MAEMSRTKFRSRLFTKYVALFVAVVGVALLSNGIFEVFFYYREHKAGADPDPARAGRGRGREDQPVHQGNRKPARLDHPIAVVGGLACEQRRFDALRLLRQVPADHRTGAGRCRPARSGLRVSRLAMDVVDSGLDLSKEPKFTEAVANKVYYGPVYFRRRVRALHDAGAGRHPQGRRRQHRRGQSQADLGRGLADQGRRTRPCLCGRRGRAA